MATHDLKTWKEYFQQVWDGKKRFEVRKNDRNFNLWDNLCLMEYLPEESKQSGNDVFSGRWIMCKIEYILEGGQFGIEPGYVVMSIVIENKYP